MRLFRRSRGWLAVVALGMLLLAGAAWAHASLHVHASTSEDCAPCRLLHLCSAADLPSLARSIPPPDVARLTLAMASTTGEAILVVGSGRAPPLAG
jgi:hypothetical protein